VLRLPISVLTSEQGPALGSAIHAAVAAGAYPDVRAAGEAMGRVERAAYAPRDDASAVYDRLYAEYLTLHDYFGRHGNDVMRRLKGLRREVLGATASAEEADSASDTEANSLEVSA
jgi:L-ribulokinase